MAMSENGAPHKSMADGVLDPAKRQVGTLYAKALLGATEKAGSTDAVLAELDSFIDDVLARFPRLEAVLASGVIAKDEKLAILRRVLGAQASPLFMNFLNVLATHARLDALGAIRRAGHDLYDQLRRRIRVDVATATPLDDDLAGQMVEQLRPRLGGEPILTRRVDPDLIAGVVLRVGDTVYDGSVATQLKQLCGQMINRSVHEIQSRRDRFGNSAGD